MTNLLCKNTLAIALAGLAMMPLAQAGTFDPKNVEASDLISGIYSIKMKQTGMTPKIRVRSDGKTFTDLVPGQAIKWEGTARGVCRVKRKIRKFHWWINDNSQVGPNSYYQSHKKLVEKKWLNSKHSSDKYEVAGSLLSPIPNGLKNDAIKACNNWLNGQLNQGKDIQNVLKKEHTIYSSNNNNTRLAAVTFLQCSENAGLNTKLAHAYQNVRVNFVCEGFDFPKPKPVPKQMGNLTQPFMLDKPLISVQPKNYTGSCPVDIKVEGTLKGNKGQQKVKYRWVHKGGMGPVGTAMLNTSGWKTVKTTLKDIGKKPSGNEKGINAKAPKPQGNPGMNFQAQGQGPNVFTGTVQLKALPFNQNNWNKAKTSATATYKVTCKEPLKPTPGKLPQLPGFKKPDLLPTPSLTLGDKTANWGSSMVVDASKGSGKKRGEACELRMAYDVKNQGQADANKPFKSRLFTGNNTLHQMTIPKLAKGASKKVSGLVYLEDGSYTIGVFVDSMTKVAESNEVNNKNRIQVTVKNCGPKPERPRPKPATKSEPPSTAAPQSAPSRPNVPLRAVPASKPPKPARSVE